MNQTVILENRASRGIRAYTSQFVYQNFPFVCEVYFNNVKGHFMVEFFNDTYPRSDQLGQVIRDLYPMEHILFKKFQDVISKLEEKFQFKIVLDESTADWEKNIKYNEDKVIA